MTIMKYTATFRQKIAWLFLRWLAPAIVFALLAGCASVNPEPFAKYRSAVQEAQSGIDAVMSSNYNWTRSGFIDEFSSNPEHKFSELLIQPSTDYGWSFPNPTNDLKKQTQIRLAQLNPDFAKSDDAKSADLNLPVFLKVKQIRSGLAQLNTAFSEYADLLAKLAGNDLVSAAAFDLLAKDLNQNTRDAVKSLQITAPPEGIAIFSTAASEAARLYIENRRQSNLIEAITSNQQNVINYSDLCVSLLHTIRGNIKAYYVDRAEPIKIAWNSTTGEKRQKNTEAMLNLNEQYADAMRVLQELETAYSALPDAHADLAKAIEKPEQDIKGVQKLYASAKRLQKLYEALKNTEEKATKTEKP